MVSQYVYYGQPVPVVYVLCLFGWFAKIPRIISSWLLAYVGNLWMLETLAYANDNALLASMARAMRELINTCDDFATKFDVVFNASVKLGKADSVFGRWKSRHLNCNIKIRLYL